MERFKVIDMNEIFISYKAEEFDYAKNVKIALEESGISCWMAPMSIKGGSSYASEIPKAIRSCKIFVLILSEKAQSSNWIPRELDQAINENKIVMPFMIENCTLKDEFAFYLSNVQRYNAYESKSDALEKMICEICTVLGIERKIPVDSSTQNKPEPEPIISDFSDNKSLKKKSKTVKSKKTTSKNKLLKIASFVAVFAIAISVLSAVLYKFSFVEIAGEKVKKNTYSINFIEPKSLSEEDIDKITMLKNLSSVNLDACELPQGSLQKLVNLDVLSLSLNGCGLTDSEFSSVDFSNSKITTFYFCDNDISDLTVLDKTTNLKKLYIDYTTVSNLSFASNLNLEVFSANNCSISDFSGLSSNTEIRELYLNGTSLSSLDFLKESGSKLEIISLNDNKLKDFTGLEKSIYIEEIYASNNNLESLNGLQNTSLLRIVNLNNNSIGDFSYISNSLKCLTEIYLIDNNAKSVDFLYGAENLKCVYIDSNYINTLEPLSMCANLSEVSAKNNKLTNTEGLENSLGIEYLNLSNNEISNIESISSISFNSEFESMTLFLENNNLEKLVLPNVKFALLSVFGNSIKDYSFIADIDCSSIITDYFDVSFIENAADCGFSQIYIVDCPLSKQVEISNLFGEYRINFSDKEKAEEIVSGFIKKI